MSPLEKIQLYPAQICLIEFVAVSDITSYVRVKNFAAVITLAGQLTWNKLYATPVNIQYSEKIELTSAGNIYRQELKSWFPGLDHNSIELLLQLLNIPLLIRITFQDSTSIVFGNPDEPMKLLPDFETGTRTGYPVTITGLTTERFRIIYENIQSIPQ